MDNTTSNVLVVTNVVNFGYVVSGHKDIDLDMKVMKEELLPFVRGSSLIHRRSYPCQTEFKYVTF